MTTKHTPAPWLLYKSDLHTSGFEINANGINIATISNPYSIQAGNHNLVTAAPELLDALIEMIELCTFIAPDISSNLIDNAHAAIAKATQ